MSNFPLPYHKVGSWTTLYQNYLSDKHQINVIVCPEPKFTFEKIQYALVKDDIFKKWRRKFSVFPFRQFLKPLEKVLHKDQKHIIQVIDNSGIVPALHQFLQRKKIRQACHIQYFYHGFPPMFDQQRGREFLESIDELIFLTHDSYNAHVERYGNLPCAHAVMYNGVDTKVFFKVTDAEKQT
ncbi:MAG TPA: glycosyl transferase family 1, partial [Flavobacterium sp.]|nr:glycosyl transferase family 1 [Flavobacterium sp.]